MYYVHVVIRAFASHQFDLGSNPGVNAMCGLSLCWLSPLLRVCFFWGVLWISPSSKTNIPKFQFDCKWPVLRQRITVWMHYTVPQNHYLHYLFKCLRRINFIKLSYVFQTSQLCKTYTFSFFLFCS